VGDDTPPLPSPFVLMVSLIALVLRDGLALRGEIFGVELLPFVFGPELIKFALPPIIIEPDLPSNFFAAIGASVALGANAISSPCVSGDRFGLDFTSKSDDVRDGDASRFSIGVPVGEIDSCLPRLLDSGLIVFELDVLKLGRECTIFESVVFALLLLALSCGTSRSEENFFISSEMRGDTMLLLSLGEFVVELRGESSSTLSTFAHLSELKLVVPNSGSSTTGNDSA